MMEKKKLLVVSIAVGVFLVITIAASYFVFSPKGNASTTTVPTIPTIPVGHTQNNYENTAIATNIPVLTLGPETAKEDKSAAQFNPVSSPNLLVPVQPVVPAGPASADPADMVRNPNGVQGLKPSPQVISVAPPSRAGVSDAPPSGKAVSRSDTQAAVQPLPIAETKAPQQRPEIKQAAVPAKAEVKTQAAVIPRDEFWVQAGAFSLRSGADEVKNKLDEKGIKSIIENREVNGSAFFRVRVGPYTSKNEAEYWLTYISNIAGLEKSLVMQTQGRL
ncbi:SPOR domain-containing protein [Breznakiellaceae bacterium SP9]